MNEKKMKTVKETSGTTLSTLMFELKWSQKKNRKREGPRKYLQTIQSETSLTWERKYSIKFKKCSASHKFKEKYAEIYINQNNKKLNTKING